MTESQQTCPIILLLLILPAYLTGATNLTDFAVSPASQCGLLPISPNTASQNDHDIIWPWLVSLETLDGSALLCSGVILNPRWVVTSADCAQNIATTTDGEDQPGETTEDGGADQSAAAADTSFDLQAVAGVSCLTCQDQPKQQSRQIVEVHLHPEFDSDSLANNLALLRVAEDFDFSEDEAAVAPVCLAGTSDLLGDLPDTASCQTVGWPTTQIGEDEELRLLQANVAIAQQSVCDSDFASNLGNATLRPDEICALIELAPLGSVGNAVNDTTADESRTHCHWGGSGDPLFCRGPASTAPWELWGVASWGGKCSPATAEPLRQLAVYGRIREFATWIKDTAVLF